MWIHIVAYFPHERTLDTEISKHELSNRITSVYSSLLRDGQRANEITQ
jgi:hypothetical protein